MASFSASFVPNKLGSIAAHIAALTGDPFERLGGAGAGANIEAARRDFCVVDTQTSSSLPVTFKIEHRSWTATPEGDDAEHSIEGDDMTTRCARYGECASSSGFLSLFLLCGIQSLDLFPRERR